MDISRKTDYALRMIAALVEDPGGVVSVRTAASESRVPYSFARSIQHDLAVAGLVTNTRGANGGMRLAVDPKETTLLQVVEAVQGSVCFSGCLNADGRGGECPNRAHCHYSPVWCNAEHMLRAFFSKVTLYELIVEKRSPLLRGGFELVPEDEARAAAGMAAAAVRAASPDAGPDAAPASDGPDA